MKWLWRFCDEETSLWKEVIVHKFGQNSPWCSNEVNCTYGTGVWRAIRGLWSKLQENSKFRVGNGNNVRFWKDNWIGEVPLQDKFPDLMLLSSNPEIVVSDCWSPQGWNLNFRRHLNDWEVERVVDLLKEVDTFGGTIMEPDRLRWRHSSEGNFTVNKLYKRENSIMQEEELKIWRNVWKNIAPTKVKCFTC